MTAAILSILAYLIPFILEAWKANDPQRKQEAQYAAIQTGRQDITAGDSDAVNGRIDRLLSIPAAAGNNPSGEQCGEVTTGRLNAILGMADPGRGVGADTGAGGEVPGSDASGQVIHG